MQHRPQPSKRIKIGCTAKFAEAVSVGAFN